MKIHMPFLMFQLASNMLSLFDPTLEPMVVPEEDPLKLIPLYRSPKVQAGILPGMDYLTYAQQLFTPPNFNIH